MVEAEIAIETGEGAITTFVVRAAFELDFASKESLARMSELMRAVSHRMVGRDAAALFAHAERDAAADASRVGVVGYVACAEHDEWVPLAMIDRFEAALQAAGTRGHVERHWGTKRGFAFSDRPAYDARADARHGAALLELFARNLKPGASQPAGERSA
jgi:carboxymethylenebutenolidase